MGLPAAKPVVDASPIAEVELKLSAVAPNGLLNETRKVGRITRIELICVDVVGYLSKDF